MPLWRLVPVDPLDGSWEASAYCGEAIVRARTESDARAAAAKAFGVKTRFPPGAGIKAPPWRRPDRVTVEPVDDPLYDAKGPTEVLYPPQP